MSGPQRGETGAPQSAMPQSAAPPSVTPPSAQWGPVTGSPVPSWAVGSIPGAPTTDVPAGYPPVGDVPAADGLPGPGARAGHRRARTGGPTRWGVARVLAVAVIALGLLNFIWGFLPELALPQSTTTQGSLSVFSIGPAYVPILLLTAGLLAMTAFLPGEEPASFAVAAVSSGGAIGAIVSLGTQDAVSGFGQVSKGMGAILLVIFGIIQAVVALTAFVIGSGLALNPRAAGQSPGLTGSGVPAPAGATPAAHPAAAPGPAQPYPGQPYPGQPPGQPFPGQSYPGQGWSAPAGRPGAAGDVLAQGSAGWAPAGYGPVPSTPARQAGPGGPGGPVGWEPSRSSVPPSADARSDDTDPHGIPVIDPAGPSAASVVPGSGQPGDDRRPADTTGDRDPTRDS